MTLFQELHASDKIRFQIWPHSVGETRRDSLLRLRSSFGRSNLGNFVIIFVNGVFERFDTHEWTVRKMLWPSFTVAWGT